LRALSGRARVRLVAGVSPGSDHLVRAIRDQGIDVIAAGVGDRRPLDEALRAGRALLRGEPYVSYRRHDRPAMRHAVAAAVATEKPDVLYLDHLDSFLFAEASPGSRVAIDLHNIYSMMVERMGHEHRSRMAGAYLRREAGLLRKVERRAATRADVVTTVSEPETDYFRALGARTIALVPNGVDCPAYASMPVGREVMTRPVVLFVGGLSWPPNAGAVRYLASTVLPELRRMHPTAVVRVVGRISSSLREELSRCEGVEVTGDVPDVRPYLVDATVVAVALESGGGTRLKILEAFAAGIPVVSTPVGCEGIAGEHGRHLIVAERPAFAAEIGRLIEQPSVGRELARAARQLAEETYDWGVVGRRAADAVLSGT
jgi:glycosyltransferase involved in cell wall biosynthesis